MCVGVLMLAGCGQSPATPSPTGSAPDPTGSAPSDSGPPASMSPPTSASPSGPPTAPAVIPTDCTTLIAENDYFYFFGDTPLNDPAFSGSEPLGRREPSPPPAGATADEVLDGAVQLMCIWAYPEADITSLQATVATVDHDIAERRMRELEDDGSTCYDKLLGRVCDLTRLNDTYRVYEQQISFLRDNVFITVDQANMNTVGLLESMVDSLWP